MHRFFSTVFLSSFLLRVGKIILKAKKKTSRPCLCSSRAEIWERMRSFRRAVWMRAAVFSPSCFKQDVYLPTSSASSTSAIPSGRRGLVPSPLPSLWLSEPFYTVMLNKGCDIYPPELPSHPRLTSPKALHQSCNAVAHFLTRASKPNVETLWRQFLRVEYSPQKKCVPLLLRDAGVAERVYYTFHQAVVHSQAHVFFFCLFQLWELKRS